MTKNPTYRPTIRDFFPRNEVGAASAVKKWEDDHGISLSQFEANLEAQRIQPVTVTQ